MYLSKELVSKKCNSRPHQDKTLKNGIWSKHKLHRHKVHGLCDFYSNQPKGKNKIVTIDNTLEENVRNSILLCFVVKNSLKYFLFFIVKNSRIVSIF